MYECLFFFVAIDMITIHGHGKMWYEHTVVPRSILNVP